MIAKRREYVEDSRLDSRNYTWFGVRVTPQKETVAEFVLRDEGFATFVLVRKSWEFSNGTTKARMKKREIRRPILPGLVFVGMNDRTPGWDRVFAYRLVIGVVGWGGEPRPIPHDTRPASNGLPERPGLRSLIWRQAGGEFNAPDYEKYQDTHRTFAIGDDVVTLGEAMRGKVMGMEDRTAKVLINFLGGHRIVTLDVAKLRAAE